MVDHVKMTCKGNELPSTIEDTTIVICVLFSTLRTYMSFDPLFSHVISPFIGFYANPYFICVYDK